MALPKIGLEAVLDLGNFSRGMKEYNAGVSGMEKTTATAATGLKGVGAQFGSMASSVVSVAPVIAGATAAFYTLGKALEFGKEGAVLAQTKESFDRLMTSMGVAPDILQQMRDATLDTVDNQTLMSSTMTLLAGTSEELGRAMAENAPQLLTIAKAANKLNPALGDTSFLYQSLATGIKRSSPLILDNLGLTIKVGEANEKYAAKLGKSVEALSAEEKQMALLEAALESGDRMIEQVGGSVEAMGDDFDAAMSKMKDATDRLKITAFPILADLADLIADIIDQTTRAANVEKQIVLLGSAAVKAAFHFHTFRNAGAEFKRSLKDDLGITEQMITEFDRLTGGVDAFSEAMDPYQEMMREAAKETEGFSDAQYDATITTKDLESAQKALDAAIKDIRKSYESFFGSLAKGIVSYRNLGKAQAESAETYEKKLADLRKEAGKAYADIQEGFRASLPDATSVEDRMGMAGDAWDEWALRIQAIIEGGVESPWYQALRDMGYEKPPDVGMTTWLEDLKTKFYAGQLPDLLPPEWAAKVKAQQEEATRVVQAENAKRLAEVQRAREAELEAERQARNAATLELALTLAENTQQLQAWSEQRFGPDMAPMADTAAEVIALLESGMLDIDADLQAIIENSTAGVQEALNTTGTLAEENKKLLDDLVSTDYVAQAQAQLERSLSLDNIKAPFNASAAELGYSIEDNLPKTPFDNIMSEFDGAALSIITQAGLMGLDLGGTFEEIDLNWAAMVQSQIMTWDEGMTDVERVIQEKVIEKLAEIPTRIVVTVTTEQEGGTEGKQHGGPVSGGVPYIVGEAGPELFVPDSPGTIIPDLGMILPDLAGIAGGGGGGATVGGPVINLDVRASIYNDMDAAEFEARTLRTVQRALQGG